MLFVSFGIISYAESADYKFNYNDSNAVLHNINFNNYYEKVNYSHFTDNNLNTYWRMPGERTVKISFEDSPIVAYFIKARRQREISKMTLLLNGIKTSFNIKETYEKDGGTYYVFDKPVLANSIEFFISYSYFYELEFFCTSFIKLSESNITSKSIKLDYELLNDTAIEYSIFVNGELVTTTKETTYNITSLSPNTEYTIEVKAKSISGEFFETTKKIKTKALGLELINCNRDSNIKINDTLIYVFNNDIASIKYNSNDCIKDYKVDGKKVIFTLNNSYEQVVNMDFMVTDKYKDSLTFNKKYTTIKKGGILFDFSFVTDWVSDLMSSLRKSAKTVLLVGFGLLAIIIGSFFLIGLSKKSVKKSR